MSGTTLYVVGKQADYYLYAIDALTGEILWRFQAASDSNTSVALSHHVAYWGTNLLISDARVFAVDVRTLQELWRRTVDYAANTPAIAGGLVFVTTGGDTLYAFDAQTGHVVWTAPTGAAGKVTLANGIAYVPGGGLLQAFAMRTGQLLWSYDPSSSPQNVSVANGAVYFGTDTGSLFAMRLPA